MVENGSWSGCQSEGDARGHSPSRAMGSGRVIIGDRVRQAEPVRPTAKVTTGSGNRAQAAWLAPESCARTRPSARRLITT